jgi:hypothetical protein
MIGIALFGNFGTFQALLIVIGFALLDDLPPPRDKAELEAMTNDGVAVEATTKSALSLLEVAVSVVSVAVAAGAAVWTVVNVNAMCMNTLAIDALVYDLIALGTVVACLPFFLTDGSFAAALSSLVVLAGSAPTMANGLGVYLPFHNLFEFLNLGASPYHLFATVTGKNGRPVAFIEGAQSMEGPWLPIPFLYQVNDPSAPLPFCFPHFPRLDWTVWFIPLGETGAWIARLFQGITAGDAAILGLLDEPAFHQRFQNNPPAIVRVVPKTYNFDSSEQGWFATADKRYLQSPVLAVYKKKEVSSESDSWPSVPLLRPLASAGRPEYFVWGCRSYAELARRAKKIGRFENNRL